MDALKLAETLTGRQARTLAVLYAQALAGELAARRSDAGPTIELVADIAANPEKVTSTRTHQVPALYVEELWRERDRGEREHQNEVLVAMTCAEACGHLVKHANPGSVPTGREVYVRAAQARLGTAPLRTMLWTGLVAVLEPDPVLAATIVTLAPTFDGSYDELVTSAKLANHVPEPVRADDTKAR